jgi:selenocysteine-specific elongation factor
VRFELLPDFPKAWPAQARVRFHLGAGEHLGRLVLLEGDTLEPGGSALAQLRLETPSVPARGDRFVIRTYSPSRTIGGGSVIEPAAKRRRRHGAELQSLAVHETGSLEARLLERLEQEVAPVAVAVLAKAVSESEAAVAAALASLTLGASAVSPAEGRWLSMTRWNGARTIILREVADFAARHPARYGTPKGELKSGLKTTLPSTLFDVAFEALVSEGELSLRAERVRPAAVPWEPPAAMLAELEKLEAELEAAGFAVPETPQWQTRLGAAAAEVTTLGFLLERLVRVSQDLTYTARRLESLRAKLAVHFAKKPSLTMAEFKDMANVSRKYSVPLLEHCDRVGWTVRVGDERKAGGKVDPAGPLASPRASGHPERRPGS